MTELISNKKENVTVMTASLGPDPARREWTSTFESSMKWA
jgi:hypothetical protein